MEIGCTSFGQERPLPTHAKCPLHLEVGDMKRPMKEFVASALSFSPKSTPINGGVAIHDLTV